MSRALAIAGVLLLANGACSSDPDLPTSVDESDAAQFLSVETCSDAFDCSCPQLRWASYSDCRDEQEQRRQDEQSLANANGLTYDGECVVELILRARDLECEFRLGDDASEEQLQAEACLEPCKPYYGDKGLAEACSRFGLTVAVDDCAQGLRCGEEQTCEPLCRSLQPLPPGEPCDPADAASAPCGAGTFCDAESLTCEAPPQMGEPCEDRCAAGSWCDRAPQNPVCVATLDTGQPCVLGESCTSGECSDDVCAPPSAFVCPQ